jgi:hypothetical protein
MLWKLEEKENRTWLINQREGPWPGVELQSMDELIDKEGWSGRGLMTAWPMSMTWWMKWCWWTIGKKTWPRFRAPLCLVTGGAVMCRYLTDVRRRLPCQCAVQLFTSFGRWGGIHPQCRYGLGAVDWGFTWDYGKMKTKYEKSPDTKRGGQLNMKLLLAFPLFRFAI